MSPATLSATLHAARQRLLAALHLDSAVAGLEAQVLLGHALNQTRTWLMAHPETVLSAADQACFAALLARREQGEPIAYLTGLREFYGLAFSVTPDVLIPRPETELLIELALSHIPPGAALRLLDLGTGSGAIAITLATLRPNIQVTALDISPAALSIARDNAARLAAGNLRFIESDWFAALPETERFDLIVANPPYVAENDPHLTQGDVRFEPLLALRSGTDGMHAIRHIAQTALHFLNVGGRLLFEHGYNQGALCRDLLQSLGYVEASGQQDLGGNVRVTVGKKT